MILLAIDLELELFYFKYFPVYTYDCKILSKLSDCFWPLRALMGLTIIQYRVGLCDVGAWIETVHGRVVGSYLRARVLC